MKTLGLIGGMSWESTQIYYRRINELVRDQLGGLHSAQLLLYSVDFGEIAQLQSNGQWQRAGERLAAVGRSLVAGGADALVLCTNTMHKVAPAIEAAVEIPLLHIIDATAHALKQSGVRCAGLLGTAFTMEQDFYRERMREHGLELRVPNANGRALVHDTIFSELCRGEITRESRQQFLRIVEELLADGAEGIVLGCTEIGLLLQQDDTPVPLFDSTEIHVRNAVDWALRDLR